MTPHVDPAAASGPYAGLRVLDFCTFVAGSFTGVLMGDLGADVVKIEPLDGDPARKVGPFIAGEGRAFLAWNRNKRGMAVDLAAPAAREIIHALARRTDVLLENFRPGVTEKHGMDYPTLSRLNPRLVYLSSTAFGARGAYRKRAGYDSILQAMSGTAKGNVRMGGGVSLSSVLIADYGAAMLALGAVGAALYHREKTGQGQLIETSLLQSAMTIQSHSFVKSLDRDEEGPLGSYPYQLFETKDEKICIAALTTKAWQGLCEGIGLAELGRDPAYATNPQRVLKAKELAERIEPRLREKSAAEWIQIMSEHGVPCGPVQTYAEFFNDAQVEAMRMNVVLRHSAAGRLRHAGVAWHLEKTPGAPQRAAPLLGEHTLEILREIGLPDARIEGLRKANTILELRC